MNTGDFYEILGVRPDATPEEIKNAYRQLARTYHPDVNKSPDAEERMRQINEAYTVLNDPDKRRHYTMNRRPPEPAPVRRERGEPPTQQQRSHDPRYQPSRQEPESPQPRKRDISYAAGFWILLLFCGLLISIFIGMGIPENTADEPLVMPTPVPIVIAVTPAAIVQKSFEEWKRDGDALLEQNRKGDALAAYEQALAIRPDTSELWIAEGDIYSRMDSVQKALSSYDRAVRVNISEDGVVRNRSVVLKNLDIWIARAELLVEEGEYSEAIDVYDTILAPGILSDNRQKRVLSAKVYALLRAGRSHEAAQVSRVIEAM